MSADMPVILITSEEYVYLGIPHVKSSPGSSIFVSKFFPWKKANENTQITGEVDLSKCFQAYLTENLNLNIVWASDT